MAVVWAAGAFAAGTFGVWPAVGGAAVALGAVAFLLSGRELRASLRPEPRWLLTGLVAGLVMSAATYLLFAPVTAAFPVLRDGVRQLYEAFGAIAPSTASLLLPLIVLCEEIVWRGFVFGALASRLSPIIAAVMATILYALAHTPIGIPVLVLACVGAGACWTALRSVTGSLAAAVVAHLVWNLLLLVLFPLV